MSYSYRCGQSEVCHLAAGFLSELDLFCFSLTFPALPPAAQCPKTVASDTLFGFATVYPRKESPEPATSSGLWPDHSVLNPKFGLTGAFKNGERSQ